VSRMGRRELLGAGLAGAGLAVLSGCAGAATSVPTPSPTPEQSPADIRTAQLLAVIEQTLQAAYASANSAVLAGTLVVPAATAQLLQICQSHHADHLAQWTAALALAPEAVLRTTDPELAAQLHAVRGAKTGPGAVSALVALEEIAAQTYAQRCGEIADTDFRHLAASVGPVEAQHFTAYAFVTGGAPLLPAAAVAAGDLARPVTDVPA
jgi:Ferritin-like domain